MNRNTSSALVLGFVAAMALAPAAHAAEKVNRNTNVGEYIAAQGNAALNYLRTTLTITQPKLPKQAKAQKVAAPKPQAAGGETSKDTAGLLLAE